MLRTLFYLFLYAGILGGFLGGVLLVILGQLSSRTTGSTNFSGGETEEAIPIPKPGTQTEPMKRQILSEKPSWITFNCELDGESETEKIRRLREREDESYRIMRKAREENRLEEEKEASLEPEPAVTVSELTEEEERSESSRLSEEKEEDELLPTDPIDTLLADRERLHLTQALMDGPEEGEEEEYEDLNEALRQAYEQMDDDEEDLLEDEDEEEDSEEL